MAELLGVSRATVYKIVERGGLGHVRVSNAIRVGLGAICAFLAQEGHR
ncbi:MAG: helix-turn-helix domain-containing protein [Deltaproteobacteria bacterium]|nr:helix-turn-helix domain-containing protein [Deltaproteobacteria bacterium]